MLVKKAICPENACRLLFHPRQSADETRKILEISAFVLISGEIDPALQKAAVKERNRAELL